MWQKNLESESFKDTSCTMYQCVCVSSHPPAPCSLKFKFWYFWGEAKIRKNQMWHGAPPLSVTALGFGSFPVCLDRNLIPVSTVRVAVNEGEAAPQDTCSSWRRVFLTWCWTTASSRGHKHPAPCRLILWVCWKHLYRLLVLLMFLQRLLFFKNSRRSDSDPYLN